MKLRFLPIACVMALLLAACGAAPAPVPGGTQPTSAPGGTQPTSAPGGAQPTGAPGAGSSIKIGGGFALTGDESSLDLPAANGAALAVKEINASGGVLGLSIQFIVHDSQYKMDVTAQIAKQFVEQDQVVAVIGFTDTDSVLAAGPTIQSAGLPFITPGATSPKIPTQVGDKMFLACFGDNVQAAAGAEFAFNKFGKNAYLLSDKGVEYTTLLGGYFKARFTELGGNLVLEDQYDDKATDFSAQIAKVKALPQQPDFYYIAAMPYNVGPVIKQFRDAGLTGPIVGGDGYDTPDLVSVAGKAAENVFFSTHALMDASGGTEGIKKFMAAYKQEFGHDPENAFAALGYDAMYLMAASIKRAGSTDAAAIQKAIEQTKDFPGITGKISFTPYSHVPQKGVTIIAVKDGKFTLGAEVVPEKVPAP
jgi:branched-chain amino acid transport system substrate-binding protein